MTQDTFEGGSPYLQELKRIGDTPKDLKPLTGHFVRMEAWPFSSKPSIPAVLAVFNTKNGEVAVTMSETQAKELVPTEGYTAHYRATALTNHESDAAKEFVRAVQSHPTTIIGDFHSLKYSQPIMNGGNVLPFIKQEL